MTSNDPIGDAALSAGLDAAMPVARPLSAPASVSGGAAGAALAVSGLAGNAATLVEIAGVARPGIGEIVIVSRQRQAQASFTATGGDRLLVPLASGDYLVAAGPEADAAAPLHRVGRFLVYAGRAYGYGMPTPLAAIPAAQSGSGEPAPCLARLAYAGRSSDGAAQLVFQWTPPGAAPCLCIRSPRWGGQWLPYATPAAGAAFRLSDGAYEVRAAQLAHDGTRLGAWSEVTAFAIAEGRLAAVPWRGGDVLDWIGVKPGWRPQGTAEFRADETVDGKVAVTLAWRGDGSDAGLRYGLTYRGEPGGEWETAIAAAAERRLQLAPGRYRIRICAVDDRVFLRSEFFVECVATVSPADPLVLTQMAAPAADASVAWVPLSEADVAPAAGHPGAFAEFVATPIPTLAAGQDASAVDLYALAYGRAPPPVGRNADIAVARALAHGDLAADQMAAAGDYFVRAGRIDAARHIFEELGRRYRGADFALLRCAQLEALSGRGVEARELLKLALLPPKDDATRSQAVGSAVPQVKDDLATTQALPHGAPENKAQLAALRFKAQQYDRLARELPALRIKAKRYDEAQDKTAPDRLKGVARLLRRWSGRLAGLRPR